MNAIKSWVDLDRLVRISNGEEVVEIPTTQERKDEMDLARMLEISYGFTGALRLIDKEIKPFAKEKGLSIFKAIWKYASVRKEQDMSQYRLYLVLVNLSDRDWRALKHPHGK